jgi:DNA replicative helicase MCM subunit Mcm2 (Cdc46/Mcm family)
VGAPENNHRGRIHTLFIGTPGLAKSMLARAAAEIVPNSRFVTAQHASGKGITAIIDKENDTTILRLGAVPQARGGICAINELGQMDYQDQAFLLDSMEEGEFTIDKYAIHIRIKPPTTVVATTNPIGFKWNDPYKVSNTEMPIMRPLLDRFDQIFTFSEFASIEEDRQYAQKKAEMNEENIRYNSNFLRPFLSYAKTLEPKIPHEVQSMIIDYWLQLKEKGIASNRTLDSLFRISKAQARLHLSEIVNIEIVTEVMNQYGRMALQYGEIVNIIESPRDVTYKEMLNIVKTTNAPIELTEAAKIACKKMNKLKVILVRN